MVRSSPSRADSPVKRGAGGAPRLTAESPSGTTGRLWRGTPPCAVCATSDPVRPPHDSPQPTRQSGSRPYVSGGPWGVRERPPGHPDFTPTGSRLICEEFTARRVNSSLHLDTGALPAPVWPMHIASPLLLIPRTEPPLIQAQRGSLGRGSGAARWPGSGGPTSRFPWICGRAVAADSPPPGPRAAWFPPGPWLPAPGLLARARLRSGSRLPSVLLGCSPVAGARMARLPAGELA